jgi:hypothetical protein
VFLHESGPVHENEYASSLRVDVFIEGSRASDTRPAGPQTASSLDEFAFENEYELWTLVAVDRKSRARLEADDLHLPSVGDGDILHEDAGRTSLTVST